MAIVSLNGEQNSGGVDDKCHGDGAGEGAHHDEFGRKVDVILEFDGVEDGIDGRRDGAHDEEGLGGDGGEAGAEGVPEEDEGAADDRASDKANEDADPSVLIGKGNFAAADLHTKRHHDNGDEGLGAVFKNGPEGGGGHIDADGFYEKDGEEGVEDGHVEDGEKGVVGREAAFSGLVEAQGIEEEVHLDEGHGGDGGGFGKVDGGPADEKRGVCEDEGNHGNADVSVVGKHGAVFECFGLAAVPAAGFSDDMAEGADDAHLEAAEEEDVQEVHVELCAVDAVENEAGEDEVECQFCEGIDVQGKFPVHEVADDDEDKEGQDVVGDNVKKGHFEILDKK